MNLILLFLCVIFLLIHLSANTNTDYCTLCEPRGTHTMCRYPKKGPSSRCNKYVPRAVTGSDKKAILDYHNKMRNEVALGYAENKHGRQPSATAMMQISWSDELQVIAQRWADQCVAFKDTQHDSCRNTERMEVGQNIVSDGTPRMKEINFDMAMKSWFNEVKDYRSEWISQYAGSPEPPKKIGHYTQFVWDQTQYIGCASVSFVETVGQKTWWINRIICNYAPSGNVIGAKVYKVGRPCMKCPRNTKCNPRYGGLCATEEQIKESTEMNFTSWHKKPDPRVVEKYPLVKPMEKPVDSTVNTKTTTEKETSVSPLSTNTTTISETTVKELTEWSKPVIPTPDTTIERPMTEATTPLTVSPNTLPTESPKQMDNATFQHWKTQWRKYWRKVLPPWIIAMSQMPIFGPHGEGGRRRWNTPACLCPVDEVDTYSEVASPPRLHAEAVVIAFVIILVAYLY